MIFHVVVSVYRLIKIWNSPQFPAEFRNGQFSAWFYFQKWTLALPDTTIVRPLQNSSRQLQGNYVLLSHDCRYVLNFNNQNFQNFVLPAVTCPALLAPPNGIRQGCTGTRTESYSTVCLFSCNTGFNAAGSLSRKCLENGNWSGQDFLCQGEMNPQGNFADLRSTFCLGLLTANRKQTVHLESGEKELCIPIGWEA